MFKVDSIKLPLLRVLLSLLYIAIFTISSSTQARGFGHWYSDKQLLYIQQVYGANIKGLLFDDVMPFLNAQERKTLSDTTISFPLRGRSAGLFEYAMHLKTGEMQVSALAVKFFDEISIALAWYEAEHKDKQLIINYLLNLSSDTSSLKPPLEALNVPYKIWQTNSYVDDTSQKNLKSGLLFILLHELAHWHFKHLPYTKINQLQARRQESQAGLFALEVMARMEIIPYGMVTWFMLLGLVQNEVTKTHPLTSQRLSSIAEAIKRNPKRFIAHENRQTMTVQEVLKVADDIQIISDSVQLLER